MSKYITRTFSHMFISLKSLSIYSLILLLTFLLIGTSQASQPNPENTAPEFASEEGKSNFVYEIENRKDPFVPFITPQATSTSVNMDEIVETEKELVGMQLFEPGQLNLVAILKKDDKRVAMVEDVTGKGYLISEGTKIGKRGVVTNVIPNKVLIEETAFTRAGKKIITKVVMVLKKEGEE